MAKKLKNKKVQAKKKKSAAKNISSKKKKSNTAKKSIKKSASKKAAPKKKVAAKKIVAKKIKAVKKPAKPAKQNKKTKTPQKVEKKVAKKVLPPTKKQITKTIELKPTPPPPPVKEIKTPQLKGKKPLKAPKEKKIIKAPLIIPNQRISEKELAPISKKAEPKGKYELEFVVRSSPAVLFELLSTPSGLSEWFADDVNIRDDVFTFFWDGSSQSAKAIGLKETEYIRFQWMDKKDGSYFEFRLQIDELTGDVSLLITDFADNESERESSRLLWESQVNKLLHVLGSYF